MAGGEWRVYKAVRAPWSAEVWEKTLEELASCPRCGEGTQILPFPAQGASAAALEGCDPRLLPPLDAAVFVCFNPQCATLYMILHNAERQAEFEAFIPYLREAARRATE